MSGASVKESAEEKKEEAAERLSAARERWPFLDHLIRMQQHYSAVKGNALAGSVTYFGFLSFFPIMALAFATVGFVSRVYGGAETQLVEAIDSVLPGMVGDGEGQISISTFRDSAGAAAGIGAVGVLYSGLGWLSGMRDAMMLTFEMPQDEQPNFVVGKLRDLVALVLIGATLLLSVAIAGLITSFSDQIMDWLSLDDALQWIVPLIGVAVGLAANMLLFFTIFRLLANPSAPKRSLWKGALFGAIGFEALKWASQYLIGSTQNQPAFQVFGIALVLVVWIYYMSRLMVYAASWAHTDRAAREARDSADRLSADGEALKARVEAARAADVPTPVTVVAPASTEAADRAGTRTPGKAPAIAAGVAGLLAGVALGRRRP